MPCDLGETRKLLPLSFMQSMFYVCLFCVLQPFGRALVEAGKAFFGMEQEKNALRGILEFEAGKRVDRLVRVFYEILLPYSLIFTGGHLLCSRKVYP